MVCANQNNRSLYWRSSLHYLLGRPPFDWSLVKKSQEQLSRRTL